MSVAVVEFEASEPCFYPVPLMGLVKREPLSFPLYLKTSDEAWVLYRPAKAEFDNSHIGRLAAEGVERLFIVESDRELYFDRVRSALDDILLDRSLALESRVDMLQGIATQMAESLLENPLDKAGISRAQKVMMATSSLLLREEESIAVVRRMVSASPGLANHSLTVAFLSMGLARIVLDADANRLVIAGLAGLLHDVGKVGHESAGGDQEHAVLGARQLQKLGMQREIVDAARCHHERWDGSGFPDALEGSEIPEMARLVGIVNTFEKIYASQRPRVGVFDALRILAQAYRGCFEARFASGLVQLFR